MQRIQDFSNYYKKITIICLSSFFLFVLLRLTTGDDNSFLGIIMIPIGLILFAFSVRKVLKENKLGWAILLPSGVVFIWSGFELAKSGLIGPPLEAYPGQIIQNTLPSLSSQVAFFGMAIIAFGYGIIRILFRNLFKKPLLLGSVNHPEKHPSIFVFFLIISEVIFIWMTIAKFEDLFVNPVLISVTVTNKHYEGTAISGFFKSYYLDVVPAAVSPEFEVGRSLYELIKPGQEIEIQYTPNDKYVESIKIIK